MYNETFCCPICGQTGGDCVERGGVLYCLECAMLQDQQRNDNINYFRQVIDNGLGGKNATNNKN
jgi:hypothetical protein